MRVLVLLLLLASDVFAQSNWSKAYFTGLNLAGASTDIFHSLTLLAPTLSSNVSLTLPGDVGTNGYVLVTDGSGILSWTPVSYAGGGTFNGDVIIHGNLAVDTNVTIGGSLTITGALVLNGGQEITGNLVIDGTATTNGITNTGTFSEDGNISQTGASHQATLQHLTCSSLHATDVGTIDGDLTVGGNTTFGGAQYVPFLVRTSNYTVAADDYFIAGDGTSGAVTITLPSAAGGTRALKFSRKNVGGSNVTVQRTGTDTFIDGTTSKVLSLPGVGAMLKVISDGTSKWYLE